MSGRGGTSSGVRAGTKISEFKDLGGLGVKNGTGGTGELINWSSLETNTASDGVAAPTTGLEGVGFERVEIAGIRLASEGGTSETLWTSGWKVESIREANINERTHRLGGFLGSQP